MKKRLDLILLERGLAETRSQAQALIMAGAVHTADRRLDKPGMAIDEDVAIHVTEQPRYVSRAGEKLESVMVPLSLDFDGKILLDVGSSTGGFTDLALQNGAVKVYCVDVGTGQLAQKLRLDSRVVVMEQTDIRDTSLPEMADMAVIDVSFISLTQVLEATARNVSPGGLIVAMAKPQFEAGKDVADRFKGVIPVGGERDQILAKLRSWLEQHFEIVAEADSGVAGMKGNIERFFALRAKR